MKLRSLAQTILIIFLAGGAIRGRAGENTEPAENIALNRAAYQSDSADDDHTADLVTDGSTETYWQNHPGRSSWLSVDLGERCPFHRVVLKWGQSYAAAFRLVISDDE